MLVTDTATASLLAWGLGFAGMAALSLAMDRHYAQVFGHRTAPLAHARAFRLLGALWLTASAWPCRAAWGPAVGLVAWCGWLTLGAGMVAALLPYRPRLTASAAALAGASASASLGLLLG